MDDNWLGMYIFIIYVDDDIASANTFLNKKLNATAYELKILEEENVIVCTTA